MNYVAFLQESDPPPAVLAALCQIHSFLSTAADKDGLSVTEALGAVLGVAGEARLVGLDSGCPFKARKRSHQALYIR